MRTPALNEALDALLTYGESDLARKARAEVEEMRETIRAQDASFMAIGEEQAKIDRALDSTKVPTHDDRAHRVLLLVEHDAAQTNDNDAVWNKALEAAADLAGDLLSRDTWPEAGEVPAAIRALMKEGP